jgi:hypothetical protein
VQKVLRQDLLNTGLLQHNDVNVSGDGGKVPAKRCVVDHAPVDVTTAFALDRREDRRQGSRREDCFERGPLGEPLLHSIVQARDHDHQRHERVLQTLEKKDLGAAP